MAQSETFGSYGVDALPEVRRGLALASVFGVVGGGLGVAQAFLSWEELSVGKLAGIVQGAETIKGYEANGGKIILGLSIATLLLSVAWVLDFRLKGIGLWLTLLGGAAVAVAVLNYFARQTDVADFNAQLDKLRGVMDVSGVSLDIGVGMWVALIGAGFIAFAGLFALITRE